MTTTGKEIVEKWRNRKLIGFRELCAKDGDDLAQAFDTALLAREREVATLKQRITEHEMFRHQHRDCDAMGVENQHIRIALSAAREMANQIEKLVLTSYPRTETEELNCLTPLDEVKQQYATMEAVAKFRAADGG